MRKESFWVITHGLISSEDTKVLTLLYQPLIGYEAYGLFMLLINLVDRNELKSKVFSYSLLFDLLNIKEETFVKAKEKLEAVGLLTSLIKDDVYLFRLSMPLKARQFFTDGILGTYLKSEIGEENFNVLLKYFTTKEVSFKGYKNVTKTFDEVFRVKDLEVFKSDSFILSRKNGGGVVLKDNFDFEKLYEKLPIRIKRKSIYTKRVVSQISSIMYVYQFSDQEMIDILSNSYDEENRKIFSEKIVLNSRIYFENTYGDIEISRTEVKENKLDLSLINPRDIINLFGSKMTNTSFALSTIRDFIDRNAVDLGLINAVIITALKYHDNLPSLAYLETVLSNWLAKGIKTGEDAYHIINNIEPTKKQTSKKAKIKLDEPEWLDEILNSLGDEWDE